MIALLVIAAITGGALWYLALRHRPAVAPKAWDPRVAALAGYVQRQEGTAWKHPVRVEFLTAAGFGQRFGMSLAADTGGSGPSGTNVARYVPANRTVYVEVGLVDLYTNVAVIGQLSEALHGQYPGLSSTVAAQVAASRAQAAYVATLSPRQALALRQEQARGH